MGISMFTTLINLVYQKDIYLLLQVSYIYIAASVLTFVLLVSGITAPYGRYARDGWGIFVNGKLAWFLQEIPSFAMPLIFIFQDAPGLRKAPNVLLFSLFVMHYFQRACIFPFLIKGGKPVTLFVFLVALVFCFINGYLQSAFLLFHADYGTKWWTRTHLWIGVVIFCTGMFINIQSDHILRNLRKPGETGYKIPKGGMFNYVSGANFFGEIFEWFGFTVATWSFPALAFWLFTCSSLGPRAWQHHKYYLSKFKDYPKSRKAVIPYLL
ncbi:3-oxo-5-alpha-steroid 4-dehydrogenase 1-like [Dreissena polymorpha]|uniref:3-oxo-5alpha-steroid 4-dehydrogenase (NADP(+)) n=1 Tax=Dreissena polymorpha TaxID=45954 RepID=A0A9D4L3E4_DREPO|nr:3-oxo-5-alpha-steroid 4-dehydrogenase 1-like [Dreissena polymorpha]KAH3850896.1 hypothetical protein DPMN_093372 [Dreissena polymorpha]